MKKHIAYCKNHDWEGMRRDEKSESQLDLDAHIELLPSENHDNSGISREEKVNKNLSL